MIVLSVFQQKLMEAGTDTKNSGVKPTQGAAILPDKLKYFPFMEVNLRFGQTAPYNSQRQK
jgi:hypothetical protein